MIYRSTDRCAGSSRGRGRGIGSRRRGGARVCQHTEDVFRHQCRASRPFPQPPAASDPRALSADELELARLIVGTLNIEDTRPEEIDPEAPLYGDGLGLDSIDILEMSLAISKAYGVQLRSDDPDNERIFRSLRSLAAHVQSRRAK